MVGLARRVGEGCVDVIRFEVRKIAQDFLVRHAFGEHAEDVRHSNSQSPDARPPAALARLHRDAFKQLHAGIVPCRLQEINWRVPAIRKSKPSGQPLSVKSPEIAQFLMHVAMQRQAHAVILKMAEELRVRQLLRASDGVMPHRDP